MEKQLSNRQTHGRETGARAHSDRNPPKRTRTRASANSRQDRRRTAHATAERALRATNDAPRSEGTLESLDLFLRRARVHPLLTAAARS